MHSIPTLDKDHLEPASHAFWQGSPAIPFREMFMLPARPPASLPSALRRLVASVLVKVYLVPRGLLFLVFMQSMAFRDSKDP